MKRPSAEKPWEKSLLTKLYYGGEADWRRLKRLERRASLRIVWYLRNKKTIRDGIVAKTYARDRRALHMLGTLT